jgi:hypothetical protein
MHLGLRRILVGTHTRALQRAYVHAEQVDGGDLREPGQQVGAGDPGAPDRFVDHGGQVRQAAVEVGGRLGDAVLDDGGTRTAGVPE